MVWGLGNIAGDSPNNKAVIATPEMVTLLVNALRANETSPDARHIAFLLTNLCKGSTNLDILFPIYRAYLEIMCICEDVNTLCNIFSGLYVFTSENREAGLFLAENFHPHLLTLLNFLSHADQRVVLSVVRILGNFISKDYVSSTIVDRLLCEGLLGKMEAILRVPTSEDIKQNACLLLSNITAGTKPQMEALVEDANLINILIDIMQTSSKTVRREAVWVVGNACSARDIDVTSKLVAAGCIPPICDLLALNKSRNQYVCLETLEYMLSIGEILADEKNLLYNPIALDIAACGGLEKLRNIDLPLSADIVNTYYGEKYEEYLAKRRGLVTKSARKIN